MKSIEDPRKKRGIRFPSLICLIIYLLANIEGTITTRTLAQYLKTNYDPLCKNLNLEKLPSASTIVRIITKIDATKLEKLHNEYNKENILPLLSANFQAAIDGKHLCSTLKDTHTSTQNILVCLSVFAENYVIYTKHYELKLSSETKEARIFIAEESNYFLTLDAAHSGVQTIKLLDSKNHKFSIDLKKNQKKLYDFAKNECKEGCKDTFEIKTKKNTQTYEKFEANPYGQWKPITHWVKVTTVWDKPRKNRKGQYESENVRYYMTNTDLPASEYQKCNLKHWEIENNLHRCKDLLFNEDNNCVKNYNHAKNKSIFSMLALNILRRNDKTNIKYVMQDLKNNVDKVFVMLKRL